ncbi:MAG: acyltransferase, partial [Sandarakinorhabdus sp.]|nr:acyltransferase [Sandarakinorhabdus sp.]
LGWRFGIRRLTIGLGIVTAMSLMASAWVLNHDAQASFFLLPTRAWELLAGSLLALLAGPKHGWKIPRAAGDGLAALGIAAIVLAIFAYDETTRFPGVAALLPVIGTVLILAFATPATLAGRLLALPPLLWLGTISYSAYLWHQPLFAFARLMLVNRPPPWLFGLLLVAALGLAQLSYRFVEAPFRDRARVSRRQIFGFAVAGSVVIAAAGGGLVAARGMPQRFDPATVPLLTAGAAIEGCPAVDAWLYVCRFGDVQATRSIVLLGDSHAYALRPALDAALKRRRLGGYAVHTACHPIPGLFDSREALTPARVAFCAEANRRLLAFVGRADIIDTIVAVRWTLRLFPLSKSIDAPAFDNGEGGVEGDTPFRRNLTVDAAGKPSDAAGPKARALDTYIDALAARHPTLIVYPVPEVGWTPQRVNLLAIARGKAPPATISTSAARYAARNAAAIQLLDALAAPGLLRTDPSRILCYEPLPGRCIVQSHGTLYYADDDHLARPAAQLVVEDALRRLER